jgi:hypothetical protein
MTRFLPNTPALEVLKEVVSNAATKGWLGVWMADT